MHPSPGQRPEGHAVPASTEAKVALFRALFRGREDVFARRWENPRTGASGYTPACALEWRPGVCGKPRVRCGACPARAFLPVTDGVVLDHLLGRQVVGLYPLLPDGTCRLLAADFDGPGWQEDAAAFREAGRAAGVPVALERSRSGEGAHAWLFFAEAVPAAAARRLGTRLLEEAAVRRPALGSFDRLFPNQDRLPPGGFGNLVALPLQGKARLAGNTMFLDEALRPVQDPWAFLAGVERIPAATAESVAGGALRREPPVREEEAAWAARSFPVALPRPGGPPQAIRVSTT